MGLSNFSPTPGEIPDKIATGIMKKLLQEHRRFLIPASSNAVSAIMQWNLLRVSGGFSARQTSQEPRL